MLVAYNIYSRKSSLKFYFAQMTKTHEFSSSGQNKCIINLIILIILYRFYNIRLFFIPAISYLTQFIFLNQLTKDSGYIALYR